MGWKSFNDRLAAFMKGLAKHSGKNTVRVRRLYPVS